MELDIDQLHPCAKHGNGQRACLPSQRSGGRHQEIESHPDRLVPEGNRRSYYQRYRDQPERDHADLRRREGTESKTARRHRFLRRESSEPSRQRAAPDVTREAPPSARRRGEAADPSTPSRDDDVPDLPDTRNSRPARPPDREALSGRATTGNQSKLQSSGSVTLPIRASFASRAVNVTCNVVFVLQANVQNKVPSHT